MDLDRRRQLADELLAGYANGPTATIDATEQALARATNARSVVLVEGVSDQIALETLALRRGRDLDSEGVLILPVGGAQAIERFLSRFGPTGERLVVAGLCDVGEEEVMKAGLRTAGLGAPETREAMADLGFHVCVEDLEDELIRAIGSDQTQELLESQGDLGSFRTLQKQPAWRDQPVDAQLRRFMSAGAKRKLRYARLIVRTVALERVPKPLDGVLAAV